MLVSFFDSIFPEALESYKVPFLAREYNGICFVQGSSVEMLVAFIFFAGLFPSAFFDSK